MASEPTFPVLAVRAGKSFWVAPSDEELSRCTLQAFEEGCYRDLVLFDSAGKLWPVVEASLARRPALLDRLLPWRRLPAAIRLGEEKPAAVEEVASWLCEILESGDAPLSTVQVQERRRFLREARSAGELIAAAGRIG